MTKVNQFYKITNAVNDDTVIMDVDGYIGFDEYEIDFENWSIVKKPSQNNTADKVNAFINSISSFKGKNLIVNINGSLGGSVQDALLIHEKIKSVGFKKITSNIVGYTASAATIIAQSGNTRRQSKYSLQLVHETINEVYGNSHDHRESLQLLDTTNEAIASLYAREGALTKDEYLALMSENNGNGKWLSADEALQWKLIDEIYEPENKYKVQNSLIKNEIKTFKLPEIPQDKLTNLITDMENQETTQKLSLLDKIIEFFSKDKPENKVENFEDFQARITEMENAKNAEIENLTNENTELLNQVEQLKEQTGKIEGLNSKITEQENKITELQAAFETANTEKQEALNKAEASDKELREMKTNFDAGQRSDAGNKNASGVGDARFTTADQYKEQKKQK